MAVASIQLGQLWRLNETGDNWLVTKLYSEVFASYAVLRKVDGSDQEVRRVKVEKSAEELRFPVSFLLRSRNLFSEFTVCSGSGIPAAYRLSLSFAFPPRVGTINS